MYVHRNTDSTTAGLYACVHVCVFLMYFHVSTLSCMYTNITLKYHFMHTTFWHELAIDHGNNHDAMSWLSKGHQFNYAIASIRMVIHGKYFMCTASSVAIQSKSIRNKQYIKQITGCTHTFPLANTLFITYCISG